MNYNCNVNIGAFSHLLKLLSKQTWIAWERISGWRRSFFWARKIQAEVWNKSTDFYPQDSFEDTDSFSTSFHLHVCVTFCMTATSDVWKVRKMKKVVWWGEKKTLYFEFPLKSQVGKESCWEIQDVYAEALDSSSYTPLSLCVYFPPSITRCFVLWTVRTVVNEFGCKDFLTVSCSSSIG